jgi:DNA repair exonuclease SbcCD nuclease subunit
MKILHSADWHLDAPLSGHSEENASFLRRELLKIPEKVAKLCQAENCDLVLLSGDLFDGAYTRQSLVTVRSALEKMGVPVFIAPGNHDFCGEKSPYLAEEWPKNVHIFKKAEMESVFLPELDCRVYGAGFESMDCPGLLKNFTAAGQESWHIGVLHAEVSAASHYCPITKEQIKNSGLQYLALGHIHKGGSIRAGETLCAWPGCPMGHGFDELGIKGVILAELSDSVKASFIPLDTPRFYDESVEAGDSGADAVASLLPATPSEDFYRVTLTGYSSPIDLERVKNEFPHIPNLTLLDQTLPELNLWESVEEDSLEGVYFGLLKANSESESDVISRRAKLAARVSRQILDGQEVRLP